ncbi:LacI family DNA-binding transcriptional regulator [uncultured Modestobacter sp.]|uniref:LacI family DNA-binding transcriptional regulator n=1 Tax=uncultured Modestobacter sp. TaxID=380048 RepID=UPI0026142651|nr:LacI family DNA-binding transcriptional regulator [uncultured Modestobacter sp.]
MAARAGVSHQTVSRVVNGHPNVAPSTRERVQQAIAELGYRPNTAARALVTGSTRTLGLVTSHINQYGPAQTLLGLEKAARAAGYSLSVAILDDDSEIAMREAVDRFVGQSVDAVVALSTYGQAVDALRRFDVPVPLIAVQVGRDDARPTVWVDQEAGAALATRHLLDLGHRTVHHVTGPGDSLEARGRRIGWRRELEAAGAPVPEVLGGNWWPSSGYAAGLELAARARATRGTADEVTAVFVANDQMALGVLNALCEEGLSVPGDISVVGFDDVPECPYYRPPLTTVRQDFAELGRRGVQLVLARLRGEELEADPVLPELVVRASTGPSPGRSTSGLTEPMLALTITTRAASRGRSDRGDAPITDGREGTLT